MEKEKVRYEIVMPTPEQAEQLQALMGDMELKNNEWMRAFEERADSELKRLSKLMSRRDNELNKWRVDSAKSDQAWKKSKDRDSVAFKRSSQRHMTAVENFMKLMLKALNRK